MPTGYVVFGHGSSVASANDAVKRVASDAASSAGWELWDTAFLEAEPLLPATVECLVARGAKEIVVLPYFLTLGIHLRRDLPLLVEELRQRHQVDIRITPPLDGHPALSQILVERAQA